MFCKIPHCDQNHNHNPNNLHDHDHILNHGHHIAVMIIVIHLINIVICCVFPSKITYIFTYTHPPLKSPNYKRHNSDTHIAKRGMKNFLFACRKKRAVTLFSIVFFATLVYKYFGETLQGALSQEKLPHPGGHHSSIIWATKTLIDFFKSFKW